MIKSNERSPDILADSSREGTNEINFGVACFLLRVGRRAERLSQRNDIIRDDPNRFFSNARRRRNLQDANGFRYMERCEERPRA